MTKTSQSILRSTKKDQHDGRLLADWMNLNTKAKKYHLAFIELVIVENGRIRLQRRAIDDAPKFLKRYFPVIAKEKIMPVPSPSEGAPIPWNAARAYVRGHGSFEPIRRCGNYNCKQFFYDRSNRKRFCSQKRQQKKHKSGDAWREKWRIYMRKHRVDIHENKARRKA